MSIKESYFANEMANAFRLSGCFYMKIPDSFSEKRFTPVKNFDAFIIYNGKFCAIEYKMVRGASMSISSIRPIQIEKLKEISDSGAAAYFCLNHRWNTKNDVYMVPILDMIELIQNTTKKSIPVYEMAKFKVPGKIKIAGCKGKYWDIKDFLETL